MTKKTLPILTGLLATSFSYTILAQEITAWVVDGESERPYFMQLEKAFNEQFASEDVKVKIQPIPGYDDAIRAAWMSGDLPDLIMVDGPNMANYVWSGMLKPINEMVNEKILEQMLPGIIAQGTYGPDKKIYMLGQGDSSVALWGNKKYLEAAGINIPQTPSEAWDYKEFTEVLGKLKDVKGVEWPLDFKLNYGGEWNTYGYYPFIKSNGGDIIDQKTWVADGTINSDKTIDAIMKMYAWKRQGYLVPSTAGDNRFFGDKTAALSWVGNWMWRAHSESLGDDLVMIPAPKFGERAYAPNGGWGWAVPSSTQNDAEITKFLNFALSKEQVAEWSKTTGYIPARMDSMDLTPMFSEGGTAHVMALQAKEIAVVRPVHPAYPVITSEFGKALKNIFEGADPKTALNRAAMVIDDDIEDNMGYPPFDE
ncbi:ABC transporter substrate-binding protein [Vibrio cincinnatiensis]|uniref:ABC transporter substrate-binding protein n=1 Tax=Vibrio cincinnatiensis TaxID=675 RepID=UPI001EDF8411|nr:sugar ABC transporter substrate-binding protein [Vibrio cincinnatiensis]MCG3723800.1 sugar ABC transporter substrate-binding protein [Vibrio cincinnatiensis]